MSGCSLPSKWSILSGQSERDIPEVHPSVHRNLNFAVPEVRDLKFAVIEEIFRKYDFDGLEIDFLRSPPYFVPSEAPGNAHLLTEFLSQSAGTSKGTGQSVGQADPVSGACESYDRSVSIGWV